MAESSEIFIKSEMIAMIAAVRAVLNSRLSDASALGEDDIAQVAILQSALKKLEKMFDG